MRLAVVLIDNDELAAARPLLERARRQPSLRAVASYFLAWSAPDEARAHALLDEAAAAGSDELRAAIEHERCALDDEPSEAQPASLPEPDWNRAVGQLVPESVADQWNGCFAAGRAEACLVSQDARVKRAHREWMVARGCQLGSEASCRATLEVGVRARGLDRKLRWLALVWQSPSANPLDRRLAGVALRRAVRERRAAVGRVYRRAERDLPVPLDEDVRRIRAIRGGRSFREPDTGALVPSVPSNPYSPLAP